ncbi:fimbrial biogenesis chaperone [Klebsiella michiganensis]
MKLFYRPKGVQGDSQQAYRQLRWQRQGKTVTVQNPTPFYVTLLNMQANGQSIAGAGMVAPFSSRTAAWCPAQGGCALQWQTLNDYGRAMPAMHISPDTQARKGQ